MDCEKLPNKEYIKIHLTFEVDSITGYQIPPLYVNIFLHFLLQQALLLLKESLSVSLSHGATVFLSFSVSHREKRNKKYRGRINIFFI